MVVVVVVARRCGHSLAVAAAPSLFLAPLTTTSPVRRQSNAGAGALGVFDTALDGKAVGRRIQATAALFGDRQERISVAGNVASERQIFIRKMRWAGGRDDSPRHVVDWVPESGSGGPWVIGGGGGRRRETRIGSERRQQRAVPRRKLKLGPGGGGGGRPGRMQVNSTRRPGQLRCGCCSCSLSLRVSQWDRLERDLV